MFDSHYKVRGKCSAIALMQLLASFKINIITTSNCSFKVFSKAAIIHSGPA